MLLPKSTDMPEKALSFMRPDRKVTVEHNTLLLYNNQVECKAIFGVNNTWYSAVCCFCSGSSRWY